MIDCIDLFCGAGGLSLGLTQAGLKVRVAVDTDADCEATYTANFAHGTFLRCDINRLDESELLKHVKDTTNLVLAGGPPCQLFSRLNRHPAQNTDGIRSYVRLVRRIGPTYVVFENVPAITKQDVAWKYLLRSLKRLKYKVTYRVLKAVDFGVPQQRERMIVLAARTPISLPDRVQETPRTVRDAIGHLPDESNAILNHRGMTLSPENRRKIKKLKAGDNSRRKREAFADSYARMSWDSPAPTMTTKCISFSNGRFGHPEYHRGLTVREAATLQGFPESFEFSGSLWSCARQVGNAVPPPIAKALGATIKKHVRQHRKPGRAA